jgi:hypothetical protein
MKPGNLHFSLIIVLAFATTQVSDSCMSALLSFMEAVDIAAAGSGANDPSLIGAGGIGQATNENSPINQQFNNAVELQDLKKVSDIIGERPNNASYRLTKVAMLIAEGDGAAARLAQAEARAVIEKNEEKPLTDPEVAYRTRLLNVKSLRSVMDTYSPDSDAWKRLHAIYCIQSDQLQASPSAQGFLSQVQADFLPATGSNTSGVNCP